MTDVTTDAARRRYDELYRRSLSDPDVFWLKAAERLDWTRRPDRALELREGSSFAWFA
ncbi:MAG TPA: acetyl-coenzyme A synthetase N-terminal domain-containing protein, partial [Candidatus Dormibacteraeota bacterium]|nr:acetyl-coenzyme A synthetase N-terminal domain-containing protein [Candidatus Dormibacteraeota bacterium]